jgi:antitoxin VapB
MANVKTRIFKSKRSQAVRLPKEVTMPESIKDVEITKIGNKRIITPAGKSWDDWFESEEVSADFMSEHRQPKDQTREPM